VQSTRLTRTLSIRPECYQSGKANQGMEKVEENMAHRANKSQLGRLK
jgi:hypothetical protein